MQRRLWVNDTMNYCGVWSFRRTKLPTAILGQVTGIPDEIFECATTGCSAPDWRSAEHCDGPVPNTRPALCKPSIYVLLRINLKMNVMMNSVLSPCFGSWAGCQCTQIQAHWVQIMIANSGSSMNEAMFH